MYLGLYAQSLNFQDLPVVGRLDAFLPNGCDVGFNLHLARDLSRRECRSGMRPRGSLVLSKDLDTHNPGEPLRGLIFTDTTTTEFSNQGRRGKTRLELARRVSFFYQAEFFACGLSTRIQFLESLYNRLPFTHHLSKWCRGRIITRHVPFQRPLTL